MTKQNEVFYKISRNIIHQQPVSNIGILVLLNRFAGLGTNSDNQYYILSCVDNILVKRLVLGQLYITQKKSTRETEVIINMLNELSQAQYINKNMIDDKNYDIQIPVLNDKFVKIAHSTLIEIIENSKQDGIKTILARIGAYVVFKASVFYRKGRNHENNGVMSKNFRTLNNEINLHVGYKLNPRDSLVNALQWLVDNGFLVEIDNGYTTPEFVQNETVAIKYELRKKDSLPPKDLVQKMLSTSDYKRLDGHLLTKALMNKTFWKNKPVEDVIVIWNDVQQDKLAHDLVIKEKNDLSFDFVPEKWLGMLLKQMENMLATDWKDKINQYHVKQRQEKHKFIRDEVVSNTNGDDNMFKPKFEWEDMEINDDTDLSQFNSKDTQETLNELSNQNDDTEQDNEEDVTDDMPAFGSDEYWEMLKNESDKVTKQRQEKEMKVLQHQAVMNEESF